MRNRKRVLFFLYTIRLAMCCTPGETGGPPGAAAGGRAGQVHEQRGHNQDGRAGEGWWREGVVRRREAGKARERSARKNAKRTARLGAAAAREGDEGAEFRRGEWGQ